MVEPEDEADEVKFSVLADHVTRWTEGASALIRNLNILLGPSKGCTTYCAFVVAAALPHLANSMSHSLWSSSDACASQVNKPSVRLRSRLFSAESLVKA